MLLASYLVFVVDLKRAPLPKMEASRASSVTRRKFALIKRFRG
jgi:hypothetical protein